MAQGQAATTLYNPAIGADHVSVEGQRHGFDEERLGLGVSYHARGQGDRHAVRDRIVGA